MGLYGESFLDIVRLFGTDEGKMEQIHKNNIIRLLQSIKEEIAAKTISQAYCIISICVMIEDILKGV